MLKSILIINYNREEQGESETQLCNLKGAVSPGHAHIAFRLTRKQNQMNFEREKLARFLVTDFI